MSAPGNQDDYERHLHERAERAVDALMAALVQRTRARRRLDDRLRLLRLLIQTGTEAERPE